jgi:hypothetical protein
MPQPPTELPSPLCEGGADVVPPEPGEGLPAILAARSIG